MRQRRHHELELTLADGAKVRATGCGPRKPTARDIATLTDFAEELRLRARPQPKPGEEN